MSVVLFSAAAAALRRIDEHRMSCRVAVIGGGIGGVVAARFLRRAGHCPVIFEAGPSLGGVWAERPVNNVVYPHLQTNLPTCVMQSADLDFPLGQRSYITKPQLGAYIQRYAREFAVDSTCELGALVTSVAPLKDAPIEGPGGWLVHWSRNGVMLSDKFDAIIVANGHYHEPYQPELLGQSEWLAGDSSRAIHHSRSYRDKSEFAGKVVLVVGGRSSGVDIARELKGEPWGRGMLLCPEGSPLR